MPWLPSRAIVCHGSKFSVPRRHQFWDELYLSAHFRFYLVGHSNKSWIAKSREQSESFAAALIRLADANGQVKILSGTRTDIKEMTLRFFNDYVFQELRRLPDHRRKDSIGKLRRNVSYVVSESSHYRAVVSDDRLVLIPSLNSVAFKDDAPVFELSKRSRSPEFHTYMSDIERMFEREASAVQIPWLSVLSTGPLLPDPETAL